jgi:hypothetical protein
MSGRWRRIAPLTGVVFVVLVLVSILLLPSTPGASERPAAVLSFYQSHQTKANVSALLTGLGVIFAFFFFGFVRSYLRQDRRVEWLASIAFGAAVLFAAAGELSAGTYLALGDSPGHLAPAAAQVLNLFQSDVSYGFEQGALGAFLLAAAAAIIISGLLPRWFGWITAVIGVAAASLFLTFLAFLGIGVWVLVVAIWLAVRDPAADGPVSDRGPQEPLTAASG